MIPQMTTPIRYLALTLMTLAALPARAGVFNISDLDGSPLQVFLDGALITGNGGQISNWTNPDSESVFFTFTSVANAYQSHVYYTPIYKDAGNTISDLFVMGFTNNSPYINFGYYSSGSTHFPTIDYGFWTNLADVQWQRDQGLSTHVIENGTYQLVGTLYSNAEPWQVFNVRAGTCSVAGGCTDGPEPATLSMFLGAGLVLAGFGFRRARR
jgi:hypothetical protein